MDVSFGAWWPAFGVGCARIGSARLKVFHNSGVRRLLIASERLLDDLVEFMVGL